MDDAPLDGTFVLCALPKSGQRMILGYFNGCWRLAVGHRAIFFPCLWQPLPDVDVSFVPYVVGVDPANKHHDMTVLFVLNGDNPILPIDGKITIKAEIYCPRCNTRHIDKGLWASKRHRIHLCEHCQHEWAPLSDVPTIGV